MSDLLSALEAWEDRHLVAWEDRQLASYEVPLLSTEQTVRYAHQTGVTIVQIREIARMIGTDRVMILREAREIQTAKVRPPEDRSKHYGKRGDEDE